MTALLCAAAIAALATGIALVAIAVHTLRDHIKCLSTALSESQAFLLSSAMATEAYTRNRLGYDIGMGKAEKSPVPEQLKEPLEPELQETPGPRVGLVIGPQGEALRKFSNAPEGLK